MFWHIAIPFVIIGTLPYPRASLLDTKHTIRYYYYGMFFLVLFHLINLFYPGSYCLVCIAETPPELSSHIEYLEPITYRYFLRPLSHGLSEQVCLSVFQADLIGPCIHFYGVADISGDMSADIRRYPI